MEIQTSNPMNEEQAHGFITPPRISSPQLCTSPGRPQVRSPLQLASFEHKARQLFASSIDEGSKNDLEAAVINLKLNSDPSSSPTAAIEKTSLLTDTTSSTPIRTQSFALPATTPFKLYRDLHSRLKDNVNDSLNSSTNSDKSVIFGSPMYKRNIKRNDTETDLEIELAKKQKLRKHWTFLDEFIDFGSSDGLHKLENHFKKRAEKFEDPIHSSINILCANLEKFHVKDKRAFVSTQKASLLNFGTPSNAYLCAEKSLQVYAKRMAKAIVADLDSMVQINILNAELNRLQSLICSYKEDLRFLSVHFQAAHSRIAHLIVYYVTQELNCDISVTKDKVTQMQQSTKINDDLKAEFILANHQLQCFLTCMLKYLNDPDSTLCPDILTTEQDSEEIWMSEHKCECAWRLMEKLNSHIKRQTRRYKDRLEAAGASEIVTSDALNDWQSSIISASSSEDDEYLSDSGSDNLEYFTPPESPSQCGTPKRKDYKLYIFGDYPTKTDVDVLNALTGIEIDLVTFPYIFYWKTAMLEHLIEERKNCIVSSTPRGFSKPPVKKPSNMLRPTAFQINRLRVQSKTVTASLAHDDVLVAKPFVFNCLAIETDQSVQTNESTNNDLKVSAIQTPTQILEDAIEPVSVTVVSPGQIVFVNSKDSPKELESTVA